jgi:predicted transcriptional regulator
MTEPLIIQQGHRKAIITGARVALMKMKPKKRDTGVWHETVVVDGVERMHSAFLWVTKGYIELPGTGKK